MNRSIICIECPKGCALKVEIELGRAVKVAGARCPKGILYASSEVDNPMRIFTATVVGAGLSLKMIPVRTDRPIPKKDMGRAVEEVMKLKVSHPVKPGDTIVKDFIAPGVGLIATREAFQIL